MKQAIDPGLGEKFSGKTKRALNSDGSFNVKRRNLGFNPKDLYLFMLNLSWPKFILAVIISNLLINLIFASLYSVAGIQNLRNAANSNPLDSYMNAFFFSEQTLTTVGYGGIVPTSFWSNIIAAAEAMTGLLGFALATGLLYGRFSRPSARILYSKNAIITPYKEITALMFRIANQRHNNLMELDASLLFVYIDKETLNRRYIDMKLERNFVYFFPLSWTIVHPIDEDSPFFEKTEEELLKMNAEIIILIKGFDDTFSQVVHSRYSYTSDEILRGVKFQRAFMANSEGEIIFDLADIHKVEPVT